VTSTAHLHLAPRLKSYTSTLRLGFRGLI